MVLESIKYGEAVNEFNEFFSKNDSLDSVEGLKEENDSLIIDFVKLDAFNFELRDYLKDQPDECISAAEEALREKTTNKESLKHVRFQNIPEEDFVLINNIRSKHFGNFIPVEGVIVSAGEKDFETVSAEFQCTHCGEIIEKEQDSRKDSLDSPDQCEACKASNFEVYDKNLRDFQEITIRNTLGNTNSQIKCKLIDDLVTDKNHLLEQYVHIAGILKENKGEKYIEVNSIEIKDHTPESDKLPEMLTDLVKESFDINDIDSFLDSLDPFKFEELIGEVFSQAGWRTEVSRKVGDKGVDIVCRRRYPFHQKLAIQAKNNSKGNKVSIDEVQQYNSLKEQVPNVDQVLLITTSDYTQQAKDIASKLDIKLLNRDNVKFLLSKYEEAKENGVIEIKHLENEQGVDRGSLNDGNFDPDIVESDVSSSERNNLQNLKHIINEMAGDGEVEIESVLDRAEEEGFDREEAQDVIEHLKHDGELYGPEEGKIQVI